MSRIPVCARRPLAAYRDLLQARFGRELVAIYVHGSIALDAFDPSTSDIDVLVILARRTSQKLRADRLIDARVATVGTSASVSATARKLTLERGIVLFGPPASALIPPPSAGELRAEMDYNLNIYWRRRAKRIDLHLFDRGVDFAVQTIPRILHTLETGAIISKPSAVSILRERFSEWRWLAERVPWSRRPSRALHTRRFILSMIAHANRTFDL